jgi:hypothetical protein
MRIQAYLRILSNEATIRAFHSETDVPHADIQQVKAPNDMWWNWQTERVPIDLDNPDAGFRALLLGYTYPLKQSSCSVKWAVLLTTTLILGDSFHKNSQSQWSLGGASLTIISVRVKTSLNF